MKNEEIINNIAEVSNNKKTPEDLPTPEVC
jgi:hypothetical protein